MDSSEIKKIIGAGVPIVTDSTFNPVSIETMLAGAKKYIKHRYLYDLIREELKGTPTKESLCKIINDNFGVQKPFKFDGEKSDCDDAARQFIAWFLGKSDAIGEAILDGHDVVVFVTPQKERKLIEPQTGELLETKHIKVLRM